uniref:CARMIL pleckstrin homology domain-containing protein n=1 Tax=Eptatretus burgeri TaxID=7764 RepID=A0A8C4WVL9_EPTBU
MDVFNSSLESGQVLKDWRVANVTPLFKKGSREELGNYRPVSLTSVVGKGLEILIRKWMRNHLNKYNLIKGSEHWFTEGISCLTNVLEFYESVLIETEKVVLSLTTASSNDADDIIFNIGLAIKKILPGLFSSHFLRRLTIDPPDRESRQLEEWQRQSNAEQGSCGGFSQIYACVCDQLNLPFRDEVQWDVDTIYFTHELQDLNLDDFSHLDSRDLVPIVATLEYSQWFTKLLCKDTKLVSSIIFLCIIILYLVVRKEFMQKLAVALFDNHQSVLQSISLAGSAMDDKGVISFSSQLHHLIKGLYNLNLSRTALTLRGANSLCQALMGSEQIKATLTHLDLSGNILRADESSVSCCFLFFFLTLCAWPYSYRKSRDILPSFSQFFNHSMALEKFSLSGTRLEILLAVSSNQHLSSVSLDISSCELKSAGAKALIYCLEDVRNITSLDISDNGTFGFSASKHLSLLMLLPLIICSLIVLMIQDEEFWLKSLSLADSRLKTAAVIVASAICGAATLSHLDLSGNGMGDSGARMLAKALAVNTTLR